MALMSTFQQSLGGVAEMGTTACIAFAGVFFLSGMAGCSQVEDLEPESNRENVVGHVMAKSDVETIPDTPLQALVVAVPGDNMADLLSDVEIDGVREDAYGRLNVSIPESAFARHGASHQLSDADGSYALTLPPGDYWLCLANIDSAEQEQIFPAFLYGCLPASVSEGERVEQDIFWGEAGVTD